MESAQMTADELVCKTILSHIHHKRVSEGERYRHFKTHREHKREIRSKRKTDRQTDRDEDRERERQRNRGRESGIRGEAENDTVPLTTSCCL